jgi:hypothetical protein
MAEIIEQSKEPASINELYPDLNPEEGEEAEYYLNRYLDLIEQIYERLNG